MKLKECLTEAQQQQIEAEQKRYDASVARAKKEGREFDPLDDAPTADRDNKNDPVQQAIHEIWFNKKTNG